MTYILQIQNINKTNWQQYQISLSLDKMIEHMKEFEKNYPTRNYRVIKK